MISSELVKKLNSLGTKKIRKLAKRHDYFNALWKRKDGKNTKKEYRITNRRNEFVYVVWSAFGAYPPCGVSVKYTVGEFMKTFEFSR